eukprot:CAMPEP_0201740608 /NCGR_PEP_ID=MMETSP0593-20130828/46391_1 /ASSEMBLY_ACC=CAM_ASM_000672 /TAXON_ID=267983 /ORGANISM="Skeletonema japonicum, Strain CCMP2506" /LENGTH=1225 /DNA_ID=CAMNT_0048234929 /DNA_START=1 /DNA_END=3678 /DNA_ORIENTATION=+
MESEQKRLDQEHKAALAEAQKQAKIAAKEEKRRLEVQQQKESLEEQLRIEVERHSEIARATKKRFFKLSAAEADEKRRAQADAAERIGTMEAKQRRLDQEYKAAVAEAQRLTKIAADEEKGRVEVEQQRLQLEEKMQNELEKYAKIAAEEEEWRLKAEETGRKLEEEMYRQAQLAADEGMKRLEAESKKLELEEEAQKQAQIAAAEGKKRLESEQMRVKLETRLLEVESEMRAAEQESRKWYDVRRLGGGRQASEAKKIKSALNKLTSEDTDNKEIPHTHSYSGFFVSEGVSDCSSEMESEAILSNSPPQQVVEVVEEEEEEGDLQEAVEVEVPTSQDSSNLNTIEDSWMRPGDKSVTNDMKSKLIGSTSFDVGRLTVRHQVSHESPSVYSTPVISKKAKKQKQPSTKSVGLKSLWSKSAGAELDSVKEEPEHKRSHDGSTSGTSELVSETVRELASAQGSDLSEVEGEDLKLLDQACLQVEEKIEVTKNEIRQASSQASVAGSVRKDEVKGDNGSKSVPRLEQLELELKELFKTIAKKKNEAARLLNESKSESKSDSSYDHAIQRGAGKAEEEKDGIEYFGTIHENEELKGTETSARLSEYEMEEGIEVMPTLSDTEVISVNTPLSIDESAFALQPSLPHKKKTLKEEKRTFRNVDARKKAQQDKLEMQRLVKAQAAEERKRYEAIEKKLAAETEEKRKAHAEMQRMVQAQAAEDRKRYEAIEKKLAAEAEEKRKAHAEAEERIAILEAEQKRLDQEHKAALAEAQKQVEIAANQFHESVEVENVHGADGVISNEEFCGVQYDDPAYDEDVVALVTNSKDAMAYEEEEVDEFVESKVIEIPARRVPVRRIQVENYSRTNPRTKHQVVSPRVQGPHQTISPKRASFLERAAFLSTHACTGGSQAVFACGDPCGENKEDTNESINPLELERARMDENSTNYYNPKSPPARSIIRNAKYDYSQVEQDLVKRAHLNAGKQNALEENEVIEYSARRQPRKQSKKRVQYDEIMSVDGRYVNASAHAKERRDRERVPRNLELTPRARTPRGGRQVAWREEVASPREDRMGEEVARPQESRTPRSGHQEVWREEVASPREDRWGEEVARPRESRTPRGGRKEAWREEVASPREDRWGEEVNRPREDRWGEEVASPRGHQEAWREEMTSPREDRYGEEVDRPRESRGQELARPREDRVFREDDLSRHPKKKGLGKKVFGGIKKLAKARIVYDD